MDMYEFLFELCILRYLDICIVYFIFILMVLYYYLLLDWSCNLVKKFYLRFYDFTIRVYSVCSVSCQKSVFDNLDCDPFGRKMFYHPIIASF